MKIIFPAQGIIKRNSGTAGILTGTGAFLLVLLSMPLGHAVMVLMDSLLGGKHLYAAAFVLGALGLVLLVIGSLSKNEVRSVLSGLVAGLFIWTGWVEFSFVFIARHLEIPPLIVDGKIVTKPEYLIMLSSAGLLGYFLLYHFFNSASNCSFFRSLRSFFRLKGRLPAAIGTGRKNFALITASELVMILWTFYLVLLFVYDNSFLGERHPAAYIVAFGSLFWSVILFRKLLKIHKFGYAVRYAIPTVIIFWNFIEIMGRWNILKEIWIHPFEYWLEIMILVVLFMVLLAVPFFRSPQKKENMPLIV
jgi:hypothetical protein